jgi:predicted nucleic acid-binding Zn ribbon protein
MRADFKCPDCGYVHECSIKREVQICPLCRTKMKRVWTPHPVHYKGRGFYSTDYAKGAK